MGRKDHKGVVLFICLLLSLTSCVKDKPAAPHSNTPSDKHGVYVACEGLFTAGNASVYLYHPLQDSIYGDLFTQANNQPLGDVLQSIVKIGDYFFLAVNNSNKVTVVSQTMKQVATIAISYPRYILPVGTDKAYVSTLYSKKVYVINTRSFSVTDSIELPYLNTEQMCIYNNTAYLCPWDTACSNIYEVDINTHKIIRPIKIAGRAPHDVLLDKEQMLWVLAGNNSKGKTSTLTRIDPSTGAILKSYTFPADAEPIKPVFNPTKDTLYFIGVNYLGSTANNGIYRMGINEPTLPPQPLIAAQQYQYYWALGIDPVTGYLYVGDPKGFNQKGSVAIYKTNGIPVTSFTVGVGPGMFLFEK